MRTSCLATILALALFLPAEAQVPAPDYMFLDTEKTSTLQRELPGSR